MARTRSRGRRLSADTLLAWLHVAVALVGTGAVAVSLASGPSLRLSGPRVVGDFAIVYQDTRPGTWQVVATAARAAASARLPSEQSYCFAFSGSFTQPARLGHTRWRSFSYAVEWLEFSLQPRARRACSSRRRAYRVRRRHAHLRRMTLLVSAIGFAAALGLITALGCATCRILNRVRRRPWRGMCFLAGISATALLGGALAFMGLPPTPFILVAAAASSARVMPRPVSSWRPEVPLRSIAFALPVLVALGALLVLCLGPMPGAYDAIADWVYKARSLTGAQFHPFPWRGPVGSQHPEYPLGLPALDALLLTCTRSYPWLWLRAIQVTMLAALVAFVWRSLAGRELLRTRRLRDAVVLGTACGAALLMPRIRTNVILANADLPVAALLAGGLLLVVQSLQRTSRRRRRGLTECALLLCGAAAIKQEGAMLLLATLAATAWITRGRVLRRARRQRLRRSGRGGDPVRRQRPHRHTRSRLLAPAAAPRRRAQARGGREDDRHRLATDAVLICAIAFAAVAVARNRHDAALRRSLFLITAVILSELVVVAFGYGFARGGASSLAAHSFGRILVTPAIVIAFVAIPLALASAAGRARPAPDQPGSSAAAATGADAGGCGRDRLRAAAAADLSAAPRSGVS